MELIQLQYFLVAAKHQHITRAAEELNISQPALSTMIAKLESELGTPLFDRHGRSIQLNRNGKALLRHAERILAEVADSRRELNALSEETRETISFAATSPQMLMGLHEFIHQHPTYRWHQVIADSAEITHLLRSGQIDLGITTPPIYSPEFETTPLLREHFLLVVHKDNPISQRSSVRLSELIQEPFILLTKGLTFRTQIDQVFADLGVFPEHIMECDHLLRRELLMQNIGISLTTSSSAFRHVFGTEMRFVPLTDVWRTREVALVYPKGRYRSLAIQQFAAYLQVKFSAAAATAPQDGF